MSSPTRILRLAILLSVWVTSAVPLMAQVDSATPDALAVAPPLYEDLGELEYAISTAVPGAQAYFDQGLRLYYAFNHMEAIASFKEAQRLDPECGMCWWGEALSWGPNINLPMDSVAGERAFLAIREAKSHAPRAPERERRLIEALAVRYGSPPPGDRRALDLAYMSAMRELATLHPSDDQVAVLYAESIMDLSPWDYWATDGQLRPEMVDALDQLERVLERSPDHPGACHFFIHAVEKEHPEWAVECAERLAAIMPGAGHIVHMPGHIYIRVGRYMDAVLANEHAVHADETWIRDRDPDPGMYTMGYYPHNYDFLAFAATMVGREDQAVAAADRVADLIPVEMLGDPGMAFLQHYSMRSLLVRVRFGRWDEILAASDPGEGLPHSRALWRYSRGRALTATGDLEGAKQELGELSAAVEGTELEAVRLEFNGSREILRIAASVLEARIAEADGRQADAVAELREAIRLEDALLYGEPPEWTVPVRQELGEVLLAADLPKLAEEAFREDLDRFPENIWSVNGLAQALEAQARSRLDS